MVTHNDPGGGENVVTHHFDPGKYNYYPVTQKYDPGKIYLLYSDPENRMTHPETTRAFHRTSYISIMKP